MEINWIIVLATGLIPVLIGFVWYHPSLFGNVWAKEAGVSEADLQNFNVVKVMGLALVFGMMLAVFLTTVVIHQMGVMGSLSVPEMQQEGSEVSLYFKDYMSRYGRNFRSFGHGVLHGVMAGLLILLPVIGTNALFERKSWKYILLNVGFWTICSALMGGIICGFA
jgi:hypothetical protein